MLTVTRTWTVFTNWMIATKGRWMLSLHGSGVMCIVNYRLKSYLKPRSREISFAHNGPTRAHNLFLSYRIVSKFSPSMTILRGWCGCYRRTWFHEIWVSDGCRAGILYDGCNAICGVFPWKPYWQLPFRVLTGIISSDQVPVPLMVFRSNSKFDQNWERSSLNVFKQS